VSEASNEQHGGPGPLLHGASDILVVDDDASNLLAIEASLGGLAPLVTARSGPEALKRLLTQDFALILLDVQMPSMDGFQTARLIRSRKRTEHTPIIFITAHSRDQQEILQAYALGAVDFLFKPIVAEILRAKASVLVELQKRTAEVAQQAELLREHERREHERALAEERRRWQEAVLRQQVEDERRAAADTARRADELARTVAERARAERELTRINTALAEADRRKDEFLAVLAHELRNPLAPIMTGLDILRLELPAELEGTRVGRARVTMERQVRQLCRLVDDLLDISRINSGKIELRREHVLLKDVIQHALASSVPVIEERDHALTVDVQDESLTVHADSVRLTQVVANLLNNAARYTPPGGHIWITCAREDDQVAIRVRDDGFGIEPDALDRIFEVFVQGKSGSTGLGLGLTLVRRLAELHGGTVGAFSAGPGQGSEFVVRLPVSDVDVPAPARLSEHPPAPHEDRALRVVVADDNADIRATMRDLLETLGHDVVAVAADGQEAVDVVRRCQPDAALVDIDMPHLDGYAVARMLRSARDANGVRLVAMTGFGQRRDRVRALDAGFDAHLVKPATTQALLSALRGDAEEADRPTPLIHRED
jgi:two-component system, sensor histidine kinase